MQEWFILKILIKVMNKRWVIWHMMKQEEHMQLL